LRKVLGSIGIVLFAQNHKGKQMDNNEFRARVGKLAQSKTFVFEVANLGKPTEKHTTDFATASLSMAKFYALVEACEIIVDPIHPQATLSLYCALHFISNGQPGQQHCLSIASRCARLAWQAQQPMRGEAYLIRPIMGYTSGNLPPDELQKDIDKMIETAKFLIERLKLL
jgi:hypothetical protein